MAKRQNETEYFSEDETKSRFEGLLLASMHTPPPSRKRTRHDPPMPEIHELSTAEIWRRAAMRIRESNDKRRANVHPDTDKVIALTKKGLSGAAIAKKLSMQRGSVYRIQRRYDLPTTPIKPTPRFSTLTPSDFVLADITRHRLVHDDEPKARAAELPDKMRDLLNALLQSGRLSEEDETGLRSALT